MILRDGVHNSKFKGWKYNCPAFAKGWTDFNSRDGINVSVFGKVADEFKSKGWSRDFPPFAKGG